MDVALERVFECQDTGELVLRHLDVPDLRRLRATARLLRSAVDAWAIERLVVWDIADLDGIDRAGLPTRFPGVRSLVLRSISRQALGALDAFAVTGRIVSLEYDSCEIGEDDVRALPQMAVNSLVIRDCVFGTQEVLDALCAAHPADAIRIENARLLLIGKELLEIGTDEQQFLARLETSRKQCQMPGASKRHPPLLPPRVLSFTYNIEVTPQKPLWISPASLYDYQKRLTRLDLSGNALSTENVQLLFYEGEFSNLQKLRLRDCGLTESHLEIVSQATSCVCLRYLDLSQNRLGTPIALYFLASSSKLTSSLEYLSLADQEETTEDWLYGLALTTAKWPNLKTFNASHSSNISATSMLGIVETLPRLQRLILRTCYVTKDALSLFGRSDLFASIEEIDFSVGGNADECISRGVEARRVEDCFCVRRANRLKVLRLRASATRQSRKYDRKALKALRALHGTRVTYIVDGF